MRSTRPVLSVATLLAGGAIILTAPIAGARPSPAPVPSSTAAPNAPTSSPAPGDAGSAAPTVVAPTASAAPSSSTAPDIRVPAGRADVGDARTTQSSSGPDALLIGLACGGALLLAAGSVVVVAGRSR